MTSLGIHKTSTISLEITARAGRKCPDKLRGWKGVMLENIEQDVESKAGEQINAVGEEEMRI